jgi:hypothetical protein
MNARKLMNPCLSAARMSATYRLTPSRRQTLSCPALSASAAGQCPHWGCEILAKSKFPVCLR